jgi:hypothetical protein
MRGDCVSGPIPGPALSVPGTRNTAAAGPESAFSCYLKVKIMSYWRAGGNVTSGTVGLIMDRTKGRTERVRSAWMNVKRECHVYLYGSRWDPRF